jgi:hypothetical protein
MKKGLSKQMPMKSRISSREYFKNLFSKKLENLEEMVIFLDAYDLSKLNQEVINNLNIYNKL